MHIKPIFRIMTFIVLCILPSGPLFAADIVGSKDHRLFKRYEGSEIIKYEFHEYDSLTIALGKARSSSELTQSMQAEGAVTRLTYKIPMGRSPRSEERRVGKECGGLCR